LSKGDAAPKGLSLDYNVVRAEIKAMLEDFMAKGRSDVRLAGQVEKIEMPMIFFVDSLIAESGLPFAGEWNQNRLAYDRDELAGDEKFFDLLDETLKDPGEEASERLAVFYTCVGLGFTGIYFNQPEFLRKTLLTIAPRIRTQMEADQSARICPEAYEGVDTRDLVQPPGSRVAFMVIVFLCFILSVVATYAVIYSKELGKISNSMEDTLQRDQSTESN